MSDTLDLTTPPSNVEAVIEDEPVEEEAWLCRRSEKSQVEEEAAAVEEEIPVEEAVLL